MLVTQDTLARRRVAAGPFWADETLPWVQVYTNPTRDAIAVEPMTCGPDAFNEGPTRAGLITLAPGASTRSVWGIRAS